MTKKPRLVRVKIFQRKKYHDVNLKLEFISLKESLISLIFIARKEIIFYEKVSGASYKFYNLLIRITKSHLSVNHAC